MVRRGSSRRRLAGAFATTTALLFTGAVLAEPGWSRADPPIDSGSNEEPPPGLDRVRPAYAAISRVENISDRLLRVQVKSPAMERTVEVQVLVPAHRDGPRPTVYMLDGRAAPADGNDWIIKGDALNFFADKPVNVVFTVGGPASYYTDWQRPDPKLGTNRWETFLTRELPPLIDSRFAGNGSNALTGVSMGAEAAMMLATRNPDLYRAVGAHSGCYAMASDYGQAQARAVVGTFGGDPDNMFGPEEDPEWAAHDVLRRAEALRGKAIYLSTGSGLPGEHDTPANPDWRTTIAAGGPIEAGADMCTRQLAIRLQQLDIPAAVEFRPTGTHSWPYWAAELPRSWPTLAAALGVS
ncbi:esterase family protein [Nocardia sp. 2]|uniref:Esterase family protein n=1 Tax=Nocardia acididurans TaxID=2802282 RepID=A0ABS1LYU9_9NOCA|nr:alpha/beta hydrolase family protein [Nocardia acididurans]MBL1073421.1 esterase family protein [Nocardia acididurans]